MKPISITKNGIEIFNDDFFRAWLCVLGIIDYHDIPYKKTNNQENIVALNKNFCFGVTRKIKPPLGQRLIDGATHLPWGHAWFGIGNNQIVESKIKVVQNSLNAPLGNDTQMIIFIPPWSEKQKELMCEEALSWIGKPYDIIEAGKWGMPFLPNTTKLKVCSTLVAKIISAGCFGIQEWCLSHKLNIEQISPGHIYEYGIDNNFSKLCFNC